MSVASKILFFLMVGLASAVDPIRTDMIEGNLLSSEMMEIKSMLSSVQGSLITSVSLIQDSNQIRAFLCVNQLDNYQMDQFSKLYTSTLDKRLAKMESKINQIDLELKDLKEKGRIWDSFRDHANSWSELMTSLDNKVDHLALSQTDQLVSMSGQLSSIQTSLGEGMDKVHHRMSFLENQLRSGREESNADITTIMRNVEAKLTEIAFNGNSNARTVKPRMGQSVTSKQNTSSPCTEMKDIVRRSASKVDSIFTILTTEHSGKEMMSGNDIDYQSGVQDDEMLEDDSETRLRKTLLPNKRGQRRLKEMKHLNQKVDGVVGEVGFIVRDAMGDVDRKFNDFFNMTMEMFEHQHHQLETYEKSLEGLRQCCLATTSDLGDFKAKTVSSLDRLDQFVTRNSQDQSSDRWRQQLRFDTDRIISAVKDQEKLFFDGLLKCSGSNPPTNGTDNEYENFEMASSSNLTSFENLSSVSTSNISSFAENRNGLKSCEDFAASGYLDTKAYTMEIQGSFVNEDGRDFRHRLCEQKTDGGGWTVIQRRGNFREPKINFTRPWNDYKNGFGSFEGEFWFGNSFISKLTDKIPMVLRIELEDFDNVQVFAEYTSFKIEKESQNFRLWIGGYSGNATDSLAAHNGFPFSTIDRINDSAPKCCPCAPAFGGGWWFYSCFESNLNGEYHPNPVDNGYYRGIIWELWKGDYSLRSARMMVRSKKFHDKIQEEKIIRKQQSD